MRTRLDPGYPHKVQATSDGPQRGSTSRSRREPTELVVRSVVPSVLRTLTD